MNRRTPKPLLTYYLSLVFFVSSILNHLHQVSSHPPPPPQDVPKQQFSEPKLSVSEDKTLKLPMLSNPSSPNQENFSSASASASANPCGEENIPSSSSHFHHSQINNRFTARVFSSWKEPSASSPAKHSQATTRVIDIGPSASPSQISYPASSSGEKGESSLSRQYPASAPTPQNSVSPGQRPSGNISSRNDNGSPPAKRSGLFRNLKHSMENLENHEMWKHFWTVAVAIVIAIVVSGSEVVKTTEIRMALTLLTIAIDFILSGILLRLTCSEVSTSLLITGAAFMILGLHIAIGSTFPSLYKLIPYLIGLVTLIIVLVVIACASIGEKVEKPAGEENT